MKRKADPLATILDGSAPMPKEEDFVSKEAFESVRRLAKLAKKVSCPKPKKKR